VEAKGGPIGLLRAAHVSRVVLRVESLVQLCVVRRRFGVEPALHVAVRAAELQAAAPPRVALGVRELEQPKALAGGPVQPLAPHAALLLSALGLCAREHVHVPVLVRLREVRVPLKLLEPASEVLAVRFIGLALLPRARDGGRVRRVAAEWQAQDGEALAHGVVLQGHARRDLLVEDVLGGLAQLRIVSDVAQQLRRDPAGQQGVDVLEQSLVELLDELHAHQAAEQALGLLGERPPRLDAQVDAEQVADQAPRAVVEHDGRGDRVLGGVLLQRVVRKVEA
jgi:hypothetical protein